MKLPALVALIATTAVTVGTAQQRPAAAITSVDHYVRVTSTVPSIAGQVANIYVRERAKAGAAAPAADRVVLFVHGAGTPAEVAFDPSAAGYSWMAYLAAEGFDVFSMDTTGYGRSTRPAAMNDPCNLSPEQQKWFVPALMTAPCAPAYPSQVTNIASDWNDIDGVVNYIRALRKVDKVSLVAWSLGGPRAVDHDVGMEYGDGGSDEGPGAVHCRCARQAGDARSRAAPLRRPGLEPEDPDRPWLLGAQRDVGEKSPADVQGVARLADPGRGR